MRWLIGCGLLWGCAGEQSDGEEPYDTDPLVQGSTVTGDTGSHEGVDGVAIGLSGACEVDLDHGMRGLCTAQVTTSVELEVVIEVEGQADVVIGSHQTGLEQTFPWFFAPGESAVHYTIRIASHELENLPPGVIAPTPVSGVMQTLPVPAEVQINATANGDPVFHRVLGVGPCGENGSILVYDSAGEIVWWHKLRTTGTVSVENVTLTEDGTLLTLYNEVAAGALFTHVVELDFGGQELARWSNTEHATHHDVTKKDGVVYALFNKMMQVEEETFLVDGVYAMTSAGVQEVWNVLDHATPGEGDIIDFSHGNFIGADDDGVWMSFRHLSSVVRVPYELDGLGAPDLVLSGARMGMDGGLLWRELAPGQRRFDLQHDPQPLGNGRWLLFDNGDGPENSQVTILGTSATEVWVDETWVLPDWCAFQGGSRQMEDGTILATCAPKRQLFAFRPGIETSVYDLTVTCASDRSRYVSRFVPLDERREW